MAGVSYGQYGGGRAPTTIQEAFEEFNREHPEVLGYLVGFSFELYNKGFAHYGVKSLYERVRWHIVVEKDNRDFKLPNNFHSRYARRIMELHPELEGFFELCALRTK